MRLELAQFPVNDIRLGVAFRYRHGVLELDQEDLVAFVLQDKRIEQASLAIALPGERVRITGIRDVVEPRVKVDGQGQVFPGVLGPVTDVGNGRTHRLSGMAVVAAAEYEGTIRAGTAAERSAILDMWGPGAEASRFSSLVNLVLILRLKKGLSETEAHTAIQRAEFEVAKRLAEVTIGVEPKQVEEYDLNQEQRVLPRVVLVQGCRTDSQHVHSGVSYYGVCIRESLATFLHPNELLDGAVTVNTTQAMAYYPTTWDWQNHPLALGLCREHGHRLNFAGIVLERIRYENFQAKEMIARSTAQLAAALKADAALFSWLGSGNPFVEVMLAIQACEARGIKTALVTYEYGGKEGIDSPLLYYLSEANAVISTGSRDRWIDLPAPEKVIGPYDAIQILNYPGAPSVPAQGPLTLDARDLIIGGVDNWGMQSWTCRAY